MIPKSLKIFLLFFLIFPLIFADREIIDITKGESKFSSLSAGQSAFYELNLSSNNTYEVYEYLYIRVKSNDALDLIEGIVSDPNIYISTKNNSPSSKENSEFYSEKFGEEILTFDSDMLNKNITMYIGVTCPKRCNYELITQLNVCNNINLNQMFPYVLAPNEYLRVKFYPPFEFSSMLINTNAKGLSPYRLYVTRGNEPISECKEAFPISYNGYRVEISPTDSDFERDDPYYVLIQNYGKKNNLVLDVSTDDESLDLEDNQWFDDILQHSNFRCFEYLILKENYYKDIIINLQLYEGTGNIIFGGFNKPKYMDPSAVNSTILLSFTSSMLVQLTSKDLKKLGKPNSESMDKFQFCIYPKDMMIYSVQINLLQYIAEAQETSIIFPGQEFNGIIPKKTTIKYNVPAYETKYPIRFKLTSGDKNVKLYAFFCDPSNCNVGPNFIKDHELNPRTYLMKAERMADLQEIVIPPSKNVCIKKIESSYKDCVVIALVQCTSTEGECVYKLGMSQSKTQSILRPKEQFYSYLGPSTEETYSFYINDHKTHSIYVIFNQQVGEATITVYKYKKDDTREIKEIYTEDITEEQKIINQYYMPHVIVINKNKTEDSLRGKYYVSVKSKTFSTFNLYYYYFLQDEDYPDIKEHSFDALELKRGHILEDFFHRNQNSRLYSYRNTGESAIKKNIIISFIPLNSKCRAYVFKNINDISYKSTGDVIEPAGYIWKSGNTNQIIIKTDDKKYISNGVYYILIVNEETLRIINRYEGEFSSFSIAVFEEGDPLILSESVEHRLELTDDNQEQKYSYVHPTVSEKMLLTLNIFSGNCDLKVKVNDKETIVNTRLVSYMDSSFFTIIDKETIKENCPDSMYCNIDISVSKTEYSFCDYLIVSKSSDKKEEKLSPRITREEQILTGETHRYSIELVPDKRIGAKISIRQLIGTINAYAKIQRIKGDSSEVQWPSQNDYEYKSEEIASRIQTIEIPYNDLQNYNPAKILIVIVGDTSAYEENMIKYSISYSSSLNEIEINKIYSYIIHPGEIQLFTFFIPDSSNDKLYISMSDKLGDADLYLNYGRKFPTFKEYNWKSTGAYTESIEITSKDPYFQQIHDESISGHYSLMVYGYSTTSYSLYVVNSKIKMMGIKDGRTASCSCNDANDSCYFKYEVYNSFDIKDLHSKDLIFTADYTYGDGNIYAKLYKSGNNEEILNDLPSETNCDFRDKKGTFIEVYLNQLMDKINPDSQLVLNVKCKSKALFDFNAIKVTDNEEPIDYLSLGRNNIYSIKDEQEKIFEIYFTTGTDINFEVKALVGNIIGVLFTKELKGTETIEHEILTFSASSSDLYSYLDRINRNLIKDTEVYLKVKARSEGSKSIFLIRADYDEQWIRVPIGNTVSYTFTEKFNGYFDLRDEYDSVLVTVKSTSNDQRKIRVTSKLNLYIAEDINTHTYKYSIPSETNYDNKVISSTLLQTASFTVNNLPMDLRLKLDDARLLFSVEYTAFSLNNKNQIEVTITPDVEHIKRISADQGKYYLSSFNLTDENKNDSKVIYNLEKRNIDDDILIVEISSCRGQFDYKLTDTVYVNNNTMAMREYPLQSVNSFGKTIIKMEDIPYNTERIYLYLYNHLSNFEMNYTSADFLVYYYTTNQNNYNITNTDSRINFTVISDTSIVLNVPQLMEKDVFGNIRKISNLELKLITAQKYEEVYLLGSICYLSRKAEGEETDEFKYIKYKYDPKTNEMNVDNLKKGEAYYFNILVKNKETGELYSFDPFFVDIISEGNSMMTKIIIAIGIVVIIVLIMISIYFYKRYKETHMVLKYEENDLRNMANIPKTTKEIGAIEMAQKKEKYTGLTEEVNN